MLELFNIADSSVLVLIKACLLVGLLIYIVFSIIVEKQVRLMTDTLEIGFEKPIRILSLMHLVFAVVVFFVTVIIL